MSSNLRLNFKAKVSAWIASQIKHDDLLSKDGVVRGVVYVVNAKGTNLWKVGFCRLHAGVKKRITSMQTGCPFEIVLRAIKPQGSKHSEAKIHSFMRSFHFRGEWFYGNECIRQIIKQWPAK